MTESNSPPPAANVSGAAIQLRPRTVHAKRRFTIIASQFNPEYVQGLIDHAAAELRAIAPSAVVTLLQVPGSFEIPVVVREVAMQKRENAILALGVILKGETSHAENLARSVTDALQRIAINHGVPVINAVLSLNNESEARERCLGNTINRGTEAARAAVEIANVMIDMREKK
jgi:6,7-dimethyl-8-ribityllumazine synthase